MRRETDKVSRRAYGQVCSTGPLTIEAPAFVIDGAGALIVRTRKMANYAWSDRSREKSRWRIVVGTDVQIVHEKCV